MQGIKLLGGKGGRMHSDVAERIRIIIDTKPEYRRAVRIRAAREDVSPSDVINDLIREHLSREIAEAVEAIGEDDEPDAPPPPSTRKRKPSP